MLDGLTKRLREGRVSDVGWSNKMAKRRTSVGCSESSKGWRGGEEHDHQQEKEALLYDSLTKFTWSV